MTKIDTMAGDVLDRLRLTSRAVNDRERIRYGSLVVTPDEPGCYLLVETVGGRELPPVCHTDKDIPAIMDVLDRRHESLAAHY